MATDGFFRSLIKRGAEWAARKAGLPLATTIVTPLIIQEQEPGRATGVFDLDSRVVTDDAALRSDGSSGGPIHPARYDHGIWRVALTDGRLGVDPESQRELIRAQAALTLQTRIAPFRAELENARAVENARRHEHEQARTDLENANAEYECVAAQQRRDPSEFSRPMGFLYVLFAGVMLIADLPLSLLVAEGLGISLTVRRGDPHDLLNLFGNWNTTWEAGLVALGIAGLTVAFKLVIDRLHMRDEGSSEREQRARRILRITMLIVAVTLTTYAFAIMGRVRGALATSTGSLTTGDAQFLFTALALLFPVVAAYCLSTARLSWQNAKRLKLARKQRNAARKLHDETLQPFEAARAVRTVAEARFKAIDNLEIDEMFLRELYTHAYERGWSVPETRHATASLYERCERLMHRSLARIEQFDNAV